jgi:hypothetical protein
MSRTETTQERRTNHEATQDLTDGRLPMGKTTESWKTWFMKSYAYETQAPNEKFEAGKSNQIGGQTGHGRVLLPRRKSGARKNQPTAEKLIQGDALLHNTRKSSGKQEHGRQNQSLHR